MIGGGFGQIYSQVGVDNYYEKTGHNYANPHKHLVFEINFSRYFEWSYRLKAL